MGLANALTENNAQPMIDQKYNNGGRAYYRDQAVQGFGNQQMGNINNQFGRASSTAKQGIARRGLHGGSADLSSQSRLARGLQDARAGVSGQMLTMGNQLAGQDEQARAGLSNQFNGAMASNTQNQQQLTGLAGALSSQQQDLGLSAINGAVGAGVGAYNQQRIQGQNDLATSQYQSIIPPQQTMTMKPQAATPYDYLNY